MRARRFNPLKVPKALQAALPFKTKPKIEPARKRKTLEQKRAVVSRGHQAGAVATAAASKCVTSVADRSAGVHPRAVAWLGKASDAL